VDGRVSITDRTSSSLNTLHEQMIIAAAPGPLLTNTGAMAFPGIDLDQSVGRQDRII
jgi:hypothetical protein